MFGLFRNITGTRHEVQHTPSNASYPGAVDESVLSADDRSCGSVLLAQLHERIAETRHNEKVGWAAVAMATALLLTVTMLDMQMRHANATAITSWTPGMRLLVDLGSVLILLAGVLVVAGAVLGLWCRYRRSRLLGQLCSSKPVEGAYLGARKKV